MAWAQCCIFRRMFKSCQQPLGEIHESGSACRSVGRPKISLELLESKCFGVRESFIGDNNTVPQHQALCSIFLSQGRYDVYCLMMSAWDLHKAWPEAELKETGYPVQGGMVFK
ncbi:hypothetical protein Sjap_008159 [Stephania japonica]|uniref:Uncharacterized protein n=1 Tax=Stephania japonica TaxID=461633 RepID=A0AAP0JR80_9MAGN